jgi:hypothetical protein
VTGPLAGLNRAAGSRVMLRVVQTPPADRGELLAVFIDSRTLTDPDEVVYSVTGDAYRVEPHKKLMWRTRPATDAQVAEAQPMLARMLGESVTVLRRGLRTVAKHRPEGTDPETADELPDPAKKDWEFEF